jgi:indoleamine 2,3-dioxygenase
MPIVSTTGITGERTLRRAHHVLAWLMHFYVHTLPSDAPILIPAPISRPLLSVCAILKLPPVLTYSDDVLYNWTFKTPSPSPPPQPVASTVAGYPPWLAGVATSTTATTQQPTPSNIMIQTTFTGTSDEAEFYLASARIELVGVQALSLLSSIADEAFLGDTIALTRITTHLHSLATVIAEMSSTLLAVREGCDPHVFYDEIRPWFKGEDAAPGARKWVFEGATAEDNVWTAELSGPSAGQSALIHALDVFLGVASETHGAGLTGRHGPPHGSSHGHGHHKEKEKEQPAATTGIKTHNKPFLERMQAYMPRHHRAFLTHLGASPTPLRALVQQHGLRSLSPNPLLTAAYDDAVRRLKEFRDAHMRIVAIYIVGPARRAAEREAERARWDAESQEGRWLGPKEATDEQLPYDEGLKGTGGTELVRFLKSVRDRTAGSVLGAKI